VTLETLELWLGRICAVTGFATLGVALWSMFRHLSRPAGRESGAARSLLRRPVLLDETFLCLALGVVQWRPLPIALSQPARLGAFMLGALLYFPGLGLYLWGLRTLGEMFGVSSGFGVRLHAGHRLITHGPFAIVRHPMYLAVIIVALGGLLIYRTWTMALFASIMFGLVFRARREEQALAVEFGEEWRAYARRVSAWLPRIRR